MAMARTETPTLDVPSALHQLKLIVALLGTPSEADLAIVDNAQAVESLREQQQGDSAVDTTSGLEALLAVIERSRVLKHLVLSSNLLENANAEGSGAFAIAKCLESNSSLENWPISTSGTAAWSSEEPRASCSRSGTTSGKRGARARARGVVARITLRTRGTISYEENGMPSIRGGVPRHLRIHPLHCAAGLGTGASSQHCRRAS